LIWNVHTLVLVEEGGAGCHQRGEDGDCELHSEFRNKVTITEEVLGIKDCVFVFRGMESRSGSLL
jgi:hypothetical protein